jgi:cyclic-di-GMP-binding protein
MPSFDIVSELNIQEVDNAVNQARKEITGRYDFRGSKSELLWDRKAITILADDEYKLGAMKDILLKKLHHRGIDIQALKFEKAEPAGGMMWRQPVNLIQGIEKEKAKEIVKLIKESNLKVQPAIQDDMVRVSSKSIDTLQEVMAMLRSSQVGIPVQFTNMRS